MDGDDVISVSSGSDGDRIDRRAILEPAVRRVVDALGGYEGGFYRLGDEVNGCLKDLKTLWRKDDTDDERTVARIFWETRVLPNDLIPILLTTAGKGLVEDKRAIACADLMTAMTWPIDLAEELKELDEELDKCTDYTQLLLSHLNYKAAILKPGVMQAIFGIVLPPLAKSQKERKERDGQIINVVLHLIRNLAFIKDLPANMFLSSDQAEYSTLQSKLIRTLSETHIFDLLLTIATNAENDSLLTGWNTLVLEIFYLIFRGVKPASLAMDQTKQPTQNLHRLLAAEQKSRQDQSRTASSRHSRFGTTISVKLNAPKSRPKEVGEPVPPQHSQSLILHRQQAISSEAGCIMDLAKKGRGTKGNTIDELTRDDNLSLEAKTVLQGLAKEFVESCFNPFLSSLLKDVKSERPKITEKDNLRLLFVTKWFLEFFLSLRAKEKEALKGDEAKWGFGIIAEVTERGWIIWVLKRMREAVEEKPKLWTELQVGIECLTQLLLLIDAMSSSVLTDPLLNDAAEVLQQQLIYNGEVLDIAFESLRAYKEGTQSLAYLEKSVFLAYALLKMLERWGKEGAGGDGIYVRRKKGKRRKRTRKGIDEAEGIPDVEDEEQEEDEIIHETMFTFEAFQMKFAHIEITRTLLTYLARYKEFSSPDSMKRVVSLLHRQAVKAKAEGLFFNVSTLNLFKTILDVEKTLPNDQPYKDLVRLINFILRQFFKALEEESFLAVEAFFPKNRGHWKQFSSWEPEARVKGKREAKDDQISADVRVKKGYSETEQLGVVIACLVEDQNTELVQWVKDILTEVIRQRQLIIDDTDAADDADPEDFDDEQIARKLRGPSNEAIGKFEDYEIPYISEEQVLAATQNAHLKLMFRLVSFKIEDPDAEEPQWYVPKAFVPSELKTTLNVIDQFLKNPLDLDGKKATELLTKKSGRRRRRRSSTPGSDHDGEDRPKKTKKDKRRKEEEQYKSAARIEDSDEEYGNLEAFLEKEKALRERTAKASEGGRLGTMKATGTKKRQRKNTDKTGKGRKKWKGDDQVGALPSDGEKEQEKETVSSEESDLDLFGSPKKASRTPDTSPNAEPESPGPRPRPRPKPRFKSRSSRGSQTSIRSSPNPKEVPDIDSSEDTMADTEGNSKSTKAKRKGQVVVSDDEG